MFTLIDCEIILGSLDIFKTKCESYVYPTYESRLERLKEIDHAKTSIRSIRDRLKKGVIFNVDG